jgi:carbon-monoxide dehydrogenase large subunit
VPRYHVMATDRVRLVGDPVALVVAETRYLAEDACELIEVDYDPLPGIGTAERSLKGDIRLFDDLDDNVLYRVAVEQGDVGAVFASADRVVRETFVQQRQANMPMEGRGGVAD